MRNRAYLLFCLFLIWTAIREAGIVRAQSTESQPPFWEEGGKKSLSERLGLSKPKEVPSEEELYQEALLNFEGKPTFLAKQNPEQAERAKSSKYKRWFYYRTNYTKSIDLFRQLIYEYPFTRYLAEADFYIAEAYFRTKDYDLALQAYQDFLVRHPRHPRAEYVQFQIGVCHFEKRKKHPLRDQTETESARSAFLSLLSQYPQTSYQEKAQQYLRQCEELLAEREVRVGDFYFKKKEYWSASLRYQRAWSEFPDSPRADYALFRAGVCYQKLAREADALRAFNELKSRYPESQYLGQAEEYLKGKNEKAKAPKSP